MCSKYSKLDDLAKEARQRNEEAWVSIFTILWPVAVAFVRRNTYLPYALAEDFAQDAFVVALQKLDTWDPDRGRFVTWFFLGLRSICWDYWRTSSRTQITSLDDEEEVDPPALGSEASLEAVEDRLLLAGPIRKLSSQNRDILFLRAVCGLKSHEIAEMMDSTPEAIRKRLSAACLTIRKSIEKGRPEL